MGRKSIYATEEERKAARKAYYKAWYEANKDYRKDYRKNWHEANKDKENARNNAYKKDYYKDPFCNEINRITERDGKRIRKLGLILEGQEVHHHRYHADNNDESWMEDIEIMDRRQHKAWHRFHAEWKAEIV